MSTNEPGSATWEAGLDHEDETEAHQAAKGAVHEQLAEAHKRAARVVELEKSRPNPRQQIIDHAQASADAIEPLLGMWH